MKPYAVYYGVLGLKICTLLKLCLFSCNFAPCRHFCPLFSCPAFSCPAISCLAISCPAISCCANWSVIFMSVIQVCSNNKSNILIINDLKLVYTVVTKHRLFTQCVYFSRKPNLKISLPHAINPYVISNYILTAYGHY